jgi:predicted nucleotidyltransferase
MSDYAFRDHTYVALDDGSLFCVAGNTHSADEVLGCLYYLPIERADPGAGVERRAVRCDMDDRLRVKVGPEVKSCPDRFDALLRARDIRWWAHTHLQAVQRRRIVRVFDPVDRLRRALAAPHPHDCAHATLTRAIGWAVAGGMDPDKIGISGSAAFHAANLCRARDIDLILLNPIRFADFCTAVPPMRTLGELPANHPVRRAYLASRLDSTAAAKAWTMMAIDRRRDVGWMEGIQIDLTEVAEKTESTSAFTFDAIPTGLLEAHGVIGEVTDGYPFVIYIGGSTRPIMISRRGWQGILRPGDMITARGESYADLGPISVDDRPGHLLELRM